MLPIPEPWFFETAICVGLVFMSILMMQRRQAWQKKLGELLFFAASGLVAWFLTRSLIWAAAGALIWMLLPFIQGIWMVRRLKLPLKRSFEPTSFDGEEFEGIGELSQELRKLGFVLEGDYWLKPSPLDQGYRLFFNPEKQMCAAIGLIRRGIFLFEYLILATLSADKKLWLTWDHPTARLLLMPPNIMEYRVTNAPPVSQFFQQHQEFLKLNSVLSTSEPTQAKTLFENFFESIIQYNLRQGLLQHTAPACLEKIGGNLAASQPRLSNRTSQAKAPETHTVQNQLHYTWRGTAFVLRCILRDVFSA